MKRTAFTSILLFLALICQGQSHFGIQVDFGINTLHGISSDTIRPYGYSGAEYSLSGKSYFSPSLRWRKHLSKKVSMETGIGYLPMNQNIRLKYYYRFFKIHMDTSLNINLQYLSIPVACNYSLLSQKNSSLIFSASLNTHILVSQKDNFEELIFEKIGWVRRNWYRRLVLSPCLSAAYQIKLKGSSMLEIGVFASREITAFVKDEDITWGFYKNLDPSRNTRYGAQVKYFLNL
jgi:hypothetical protein